jgi:arabinogalactan oligomer / maltooligosaccharide transport system substrate-binding protein
VLSLILAACSAADDSAASGRIVLWHDDDASMAVLDELVERFMEINPEIQVSALTVPQGEMLQRYRAAAELSLGPDLFIGDSTWIMELADADLIQPLERYEPSLSQYLSTAVENTVYEGSTYAIPYALSPVALYYNADQVQTLPDSLTALLAQAADGFGTAMTTQFDRAFWGVRAYGGRIFDERGAVSLDRGAFASWLNWLNTAQNSTGMFLTSDKATLVDLFTSGRVSYYVGTPDDLPALRAAMGPEANIRVAPLPSGPGGSAGPLLHLRAFLFNNASAHNNTRAALALAQFLTNNTNSLRLAREVGHIPTNVRVPGLDGRTYPIINGFMTQARTSLPIVNTPGMVQILQDGERLYRQILDGSVEITKAASEFTSTINAALGFEPDEPDNDACGFSGEVRLWHSWPSQDRIALEQIIERYEQRCPDVNVATTQFRTQTELVVSYRVLHASNLKPDLLILSDRWVYELASQGLTQPLQIDGVQQFVPATLNALTYQNSTYGVPISLSLTVMFYNRAIVTDPARTLDDLITEAAEGRMVAIAPTFEAAYWGVSTFGGDLFDPDLALAVDRNEGMTQWLDWLLRADELPGFMIDTQVQAIRDAFQEGEAAYYIGSSGLLWRFEDSLGQRNVGLSALPVGPVGAASPILRTDALMLNATIGTDASTAATNAEADSERLQLLSDFMAFATNTENQQRLFTLTERFPANVNVEIEADSVLSAVQEQVARATILPNVPEAEPVLEFGDAVYTDVLRGDLAPDAAVDMFVDRVNEQNGIVPTETTPPVETTETVTDPQPTESAEATAEASDQ